MKSRFQMTWNAEAIAEAFEVKVGDIEEYLTDGRRASFIIERRLKWMHEGWTLAPSEGAAFDLKDPKGNLWEVRSITKGGVYFNPSGQVGSGRKFEETGFLAKVDGIEGYILTDIASFPNVDVFVVHFSNVLRWYKEGKLGASTKVSRKKFYETLLDDIR